MSALRTMLNTLTSDGEVILERYSHVHDAVWEALWQATAHLEQEETESNSGV